MLYLSRRTGEAIIINNDIEVRIIEVKGKAVKLGLNFPNDASVLREEVFLQIKKENEAAAATAGQAEGLDLSTIGVAPTRDGGGGKSGP